MSVCDHGSLVICTTIIKVVFNIHIFYIIINLFNLFILTGSHAETEVSFTDQPGFELAFPSLDKLTQLWIIIIIMMLCCVM